MNKQEAWRDFWRAQRELAQAQTDFDYADQDHVEVATYRLAAAEKNLGIAHRICKMLENGFGGNLVEHENFEN